MKESNYKNYEDLPLFLNVNLISQVLGDSPSSGYELMHVVVASFVSLARRKRQGSLTPLLLLSPHKRCALARGPLFASRCCESAAAWWCPRRSLFSG